MDDSRELCGSVEQITYRNEQNGYTVLTLDTGDELVTVVGCLPQTDAGDGLRLFGRWDTHKTYGRQFVAESFEREKPATADAIYKYLSSGAVKGIGLVTARAVVARFGAEALSVIENEPFRLAQIKGISLSKAQKISEEYRRTSGLREVMIGLAEFNVSPEQCVKIYRELGGRAVEIIRKNPYVVCSREIGMRFDTAEAIFRSAGLPANDKNRIAGVVSYVLRHNLSNGHTCLPRDKVIAAANTILEISPDEIDVVCQEMSDDGRIKSFVLDGREFLALEDIFGSEFYASGRLRMMMRFDGVTRQAADREIARAEKDEGIEYEEKQREAIRAALGKGLLILTGGPGTGKTTTLKAIISIMERRGMKLMLAAPTGRAAKRMEELTGRQAKTIHRLLEVEWDDRDRAVFARNENNTLDCDAVIIDELSMVDITLFEALLRGMSLGCRLILVGDTDQLPSVGAGNVIGDLIDSGEIPVIRLTRIFRQSAESLIVTNAHRIVAGEAPELSKRDSDFFMIEEPNPLRAARLTVELCTRRLPQAYGFSPTEDIQVLCPSKKLESGSAALNNSLQQTLNPPADEKAELAMNGFVLRMGDKVMQIRNNYNIPFTREDGSMGSGVYNGDIGELKLIDRRNAEITVRFEDRTAKYTFDEAADLELAYAVTVHKSQGSEYPCVIIPVTGIPKPLCFRNLLYTGVTRAKRLLVLVGSRSTVLAMVENDRKTLRYTALSHMIRGEDL